jgi:hypothetical protein
VLKKLLVPVALTGIIAAKTSLTATAVNAAKAFKASLSYEAGS